MAFDRLPPEHAGGRACYGCTSQCPSSETADAIGCATGTRQVAAPRQRKRPGCRSVRRGEIVIDEQLLRRALVAYADVHPRRSPSVTPVRPCDWGGARPSTLLVAGSAVAAQRVVLQPLASSRSTRATHPPATATSSAWSTRAALARDHARRPRAAAQGGARVRDHERRRQPRHRHQRGRHPAGLGCCASEADLGAPLHVGLQMSRSVPRPPIRTPGPAGSATARSRVTVQYSDGSRDARPMSATATSWRYDSRAWSRRTPGGARRHGRRWLRARPRRRSRAAGATPRRRAGRSARRARAPRRAGSAG